MNNPWTVHDNGKRHTRHPEDGTWTAETPPILRRKWKLKRSKKREDMGTIEGHFSDDDTIERRQYRKRGLKASKEGTCWKHRLPSCPFEGRRWKGREGRGEWIIQHRQRSSVSTVWLIPPILVRISEWRDIPLFVRETTHLGYHLQKKRMGVLSPTTHTHNRQSI